MPELALHEWIALIAAVILIAETWFSLRIAARRGGPDRLGIACNAAAGLALITVAVLAGRGGHPLLLLGAFGVAGLAHVGETWVRWTRHPW